MLTVIDVHTRECLAIDVARNLRNGDVLERLAWLMATRGVPKYIRSDNGAEFTAKAVRNWLSNAAYQRCILSLVVLGRTDLLRVSTVSSATSCSTVRSSTRCVKPKCTSSDGVSTTIQSIHTHRRGIAHQPLKPRSLHQRAAERSGAGLWWDKGTLLP